MQRATFYHAGCPVCVSAEEKVLELVDQSRFELEVVHLGKDHGRLSEAENLGIASVPALVVDHHVLHLNFGASLADLKSN